MTPSSAVRRLVLVSGLGVIALTSWLAWALLRVGPPRQLEVEVQEGASLGRVLADLHELGLVPSPFAARLYLIARGRGHQPRFGRYRFPAKMRPVDSLERLLAGEVEMVSVTVLEGATASEVGQRFAAVGIGTRPAWDSLVLRTDWIRELAPEAATLEGFLFPDTYLLPVGSSAERAARMMVQRFHQVWREETGKSAPAWGRPLEVVVLASLVEAETSLAEERARIAGVFLNRMGAGMLLQCDPTVAFALKRRGEWPGRLLRGHWQLDDPYNTYRYPGLPPGPIGCPGRASLTAALNPEHHHFLYFVARPGGGHTFSVSLEEHNRAVALLQRARR